MENPPGRHWSPVLLPLAVAVVFALTGHALRAGVVAASALVIALLILAGLPITTWVERGAAWVGRSLANVAGVVLFVVAIGPAWAWKRISRRDPFLRPSGASHWSTHPSAPATPSSLGSPNPTSASRRSLLGSLTWSLGCFTILLVVNFAAGWAIGAAKTSAPRADAQLDPRAETPAMAAYPWRYDYLADIQRTPTTYWPYTQYRPLPFASPYVNIEGWTRRSYETPGAPQGRPTVWMFGGSTTWGEGQRDEYTIASWLARLAEEDGIPIEVSNYGQRGWTHFHEMVLYEQQLALEGAPDVALFYDGVNEVNTQSLVPEAVPSHYEVEQQTDAQQGKVFATRFGTTERAPSLWGAVVNAYTEHSLIHRAARYFSSPAEASATSPSASAGEVTAALPSAAQVDPEPFTVTVQDGIDAGQVYERGKRLTLSLSDRYDVPTLLYWQPFKWLGPAEQAATDQVTAPTIELVDLLADHQDVYLDGAHTNEEGARLVAERLWEDLEPEIRAWYEAQG